MSIIAALRNAGIAVRDHRVPGRPGSFAPVGIMLHHTASRGAADLPSLHICQRGRPDLPGPLCQLLIGRQGTVAAITDGLANHAGRGDHHQVDRILAGQPPAPRPGPDTVNGNPRFIGIEIENDGVGEPWPPVVLDTTAAVCSAILAAYGWGPHRVIAHREWTRRKIDPTFDMDAMRARLTDHPPEDDDMTPEDRALIGQWLQEQSANVIGALRADLDDIEAQAKLNQKEVWLAERLTVGALVPLAKAGVIKPRDIPVEVRKKARVLHEREPGEGYDALLLGTGES